ncbi:MAG: hypothetical protein ICV56_09050, partial [Nitrososphaeraceae archaeon]|nr:hypothetical protein [Nitrososphaeraceae archaeon]
SILFHHYKELTEIISEVEQMEEPTIVNNKKRLAINEEDKKKGEGELRSLSMMLDRRNSL